MGRAVVSCTPLFYDLPSQARYEPTRSRVEGLPVLGGCGPPWKAVSHAMLRRAVLENVKNGKESQGPTATDTAHPSPVF
jgi:hypothetical protein